MQIVFERELIKTYLPSLIPGLKQAAFSKEEVNFYYNTKFKQYPAALVFRTGEDDKGFRPCYHFEDDSAPGEKKTSGSYFPYKQSYSIRVFVEKQSEMIRLRDRMRFQYQKNPYVILKGYSTDLPNFPIGLWLTSLLIEDIRSSSDEKGAQRAITFNFEANLVISDLEEVEELEEVFFSGNTQSKSKLSVPDNLTVDSVAGGFIPSWDLDVNASSYTIEVYIDGVLHDTITQALPDTEYHYSELEGKEVVLTLRAIGDEKNFISSHTTEQLKTTIL